MPLFPVLCDWGKKRMDKMVEHTSPDTSSKHFKSGDEIPLQTTLVVDLEKPHMIPPSRVDHIESLVQRAARFESRESKWDKFQILLSSCCAIFLTLLGILVPLYLMGDGLKNINHTYLDVLWIACVSSFIGAVGTYSMCDYRNKQRENEYKSPLNDILELLRKTKGP